MSTNDNEYEKHGRSTHSSKEDKAKKKALLFRASIFSGLGSCGVVIFFGMMANKSQSHAEMAVSITEKFWSCMLLGVVFAVVGAVWEYAKQGKKVKIELIIAFVVFIELLIGVCGSYVYAGYKYADHKEAEKNAEETEQVVEEKPKLEEFLWKKDLLVSDRDKYLGEGSRDSDIPNLLYHYLQKEITVNKEDITVFEKNVNKANKIYGDYERCETDEMKLAGINLVVTYREYARVAYLDIDNLKLLGDAYVVCGDMQPGESVENFEKALKAYIDALNVLYFSNGEKNTDIGEMEIWKAMGETYQKLQKVYVDDTDVERAGVMAAICKNWRGR